MRSEHSLSAEGEGFIRSYEELSLTVYLDSGGVPTAGWGHTGPDLPPVGTKITMGQAERWFTKDTAWAEGIVDTVVTVPLSQPQYDALVSLAFNIGAEAFADSTLVKRLNKGKYVDVPTQMIRWRFDNGKEPDGLKCRRQDEIEIFLHGEYKRSYPCPRVAA